MVLALRFMVVGVRAVPGGAIEGLNSTRFLLVHRMSFEYFRCILGLGDGCYESL